MKRSTSHESDPAALYCLDDDLDRLRRAMERRYPRRKGWSVTIKGEPARWQKLRFESRTGDASLALSSRFFRRRGDAFCHAILGLDNFVRARMRRVDKQVSLAEILHAIEETKVIIGIRASPGFQEFPAHGDAVYEAASLLRGLIFVGHNLVRADGTLLRRA